MFFGATVTYADSQDAGTHRHASSASTRRDHEHGEVSWVSPVARALLKAREGDTVELRTPAGVEAIEVVKIEYADA